MSIKKTVAIAAAAGALAAVAMPAMAFENEIHGLYNMKYWLSNYEKGSFGAITPGTAATAEHLRMNNYFEQRARVFYTAKANDDLKLVIGLEIDSVFGDRAQGGTAAFPATRGSGGALEADAVNIETKHVYLDFKIPSTPVKITAGIQPIKDKFKGIFFDGDIAGINSVTKVGAATLGLGYFRAYDQSYFGTGRPVGMDDLHLVALSGDFAVSKDVTVGAAYYLYADDRNTPTNIHVLGANFDAKLGVVGLSGFAAMQQGLAKGASKTTFNGYAFNVAAKAAVGPGTLRTAALFATGDDQRDGINTAWQSVSATQGDTAPSFAVSTYNESSMMLLNRAAQMGGSSTDNSIVYTTNNKNQGTFLLSLGYDAKLGAKAYLNGNVGMAWVSKDQNLAGKRAKNIDVKTGGVSGTNYQGTEINVETGYKMYDNLTVKLQAAYVMLGGYYTDTVVGAKDPENPYTVRTGLSYTF